jgi:hypothetical protein
MGLELREGHWHQYNGWCGRRYNHAMAINEVRWGVKPTIPGHWRNTSTHDGFEVEIAADWIELRKQDDGRLDAQRQRAEQIVEGIVRRVGLTEKKRLTAMLGSVARFDPLSNRRDINVHVSDSLGVSVSAHADVVVTSVDGTVVTNSRQERLTELLRFADTSATNETLRRMSDYLLEYYADADKKLAPLFDIIELAAESFGHQHKAATALNIGIQQMKDATNLMNDSTIRSSRHRGQELGQHRDPTPEEARLCESVADKIVSEYTKLAESGK